MKLSPYLIFLLIIQGFAGAVEPIQDVYSGLTEVNEHFFVGKMQEGIYFAMERIDNAVPDAESKWKFWAGFAAKQRVDYKNYKQDWAEGYLPRNRNFLSFRSREERLDEGLYGFEESLKYKKDNELWIAFATDKNPEALQVLGYHDIEMAVPVLTSKNAPMSVHMGITRSFSYLLDAINDKTKINHKNLAVNLHSFAAKVILKKHPHMVYMISRPVPIMTKILQKVLLPTQPQTVFANYFYVGDVIANLNEGMANVEKMLTETVKIPGSTNELERLLDEWTKLQKDLREHTEDFNKVPQAGLPPIKENIVYDEKHNLIVQNERRDRRIRIFNPERTASIFSYEPKSNSNESAVIQVGEQEYRGEQLKQFDWFFHRDMNWSSLPFICVELHFLAHFLKLESQN